MQNKVAIGILTVLVAAGLGWSAMLGYKVSRLEKLMAPVKSQQAAQARQAALREQFNRKMTQDQQKYSREQLADAEKLYQVANQKFGTLEASNSLQMMIQKYPDIDRTGCAVLYVAQMSQGEDRARYLQDCIDKYNDCFYGDGVQVGVYARFLLAQDYRSKGERAKADALFNEIKSKYPNAVDHSGNLLIDNLKTNKKLE
jgi:hypothetical protein